MLSDSEFAHFSMDLEDGDTYDVYVLHEFGVNSGRLTKEKIRELWEVYSQFDVLFSDYTQGKVEPFLDAITNSSSVWWEILQEGEPIGVAMLSRVRPGYDAYGHFAIWDKRASARLPIFKRLLHMCFDRYELERMSAEVPAYQSGVLRWIRHLGFYQEGEKRHAIPYKGRWFPLILFGILKGELNDG